MVVQEVIITGFINEVALTNKAVQYILREHKSECSVIISIKVWTNSHDSFVSFLQIKAQLTMTVLYMFIVWTTIPNM